MGNLGRIDGLVVKGDQPNWSKTMGATTDKMKGAANSAIGKSKEAIGKQTGDTTMAAKGAAQDTKGKAQSAAGKVKSAVK